jgi:hypothetical protein
MTPALTMVLEQKRHALAALQEEVRILERALAMLTEAAAAPAPSSAASAPPPTLRASVLESLRAAARPLAPAELRAALAARGHPARRATLASLLTHLVRTRVLVRPAPGRYALPASASSSSAGQGSAAPPRLPPASDPRLHPRVRRAWRRGRPARSPAGRPAHNPAGRPARSPAGRRSSPGFPHPGP